MIFKNFQKSFPTNVIFCPRLAPVLCFFVCSTLLAQTTRLIPFLDDDFLDDYSNRDLKKNWSKSTNRVKKYKQLSTIVAQYSL